MLLTEYIESNLDRSFPFFSDDVLVREVLAFMQKRGVEIVPVLHDGKIRAMVSMKDLLPSEQSKMATGVLLRDLELEPVQSIGLHEHVFDIFSRIATSSSPLIAVSEEGGRYVGVIEKVLLLERIAAIFHLGEEAVTLELNVPSFELKLSEVIAAFEKNDATVLSFGIYPAPPEGEGMVIAFRLQTHDLFRLIKNLEKYGYSIRYTSTLFREKDDEMREKALEFIHFMDM